MNDLSSYARHAQAWGYYAQDRRQEADFWAARAGGCGSAVLALMCATGEMAADLARRGFQVCGVDFIPEMVREGQRRWGSLPNLTFAEGDVRALDLPRRDYDYAFTSDFNHLLSAEDCRRALTSIREHLRVGGGLALDLSLPQGPSWASDWRTFEPTRSDPSLPPLKTWKRGRTAYDELRRVLTIEQEVFIQQDGQPEPEQFTHRFELQLWDQDEIRTMLRAAGYAIRGEFNAYTLEPWAPGSDRWVVEARKI